ncbi:hypothetical protein QOZ80_5AG0375170 [Eleusine coracana subsp. coracana]|nr:hypothetical protein QOZ80_5AG0375170 [Eleusine coracana subsp. coracana]
MTRINPHQRDPAKPNPSTSKTPNQSSVRPPTDAMAVELRLKLARGHWSDEETAALIASWAPLYQRRRTGEGDMWAPPPNRLALVLEDWRAVASAVNAYRAGAGLGSSRTHQQCKLRVQTLKDMYLKALRAAAPSGCRFFHALHAVWGGEEWSRAVAVSAAAAAAADVQEGEAAASDLLGGCIPKRPRTGTSVKEELVQQARAAAAAAEDDDRRRAHAAAAAAATEEDERRRAARAAAAAAAAEEDEGRRTAAAAAEEEDEGGRAHVAAAAAAEDEGRRARDAFLDAMLGTAASENATTAVLRILGVCEQMMKNGFEVDLARARRGI